MYTCCGPYLHYLRKVCLKVGPQYRYIFMGKSDKFSRNVFKIFPYFEVKATIVSMLSRPWFRLFNTLTQKKKKVDDQQMLPCMKNETIITLLFYAFFFKAITDKRQQFQNNIEQTVTCYMKKKKKKRKK